MKYLILIFIILMGGCSEFVKYGDRIRMKVCNDTGYVREDGTPFEKCIDFNAEVLRP